MRKFDSRGSSVELKGAAARPERWVLPMGRGMSARVGVMARESVMSLAPPRA